MPELPKVRPRQLRVYPDADAQLAELVRALQRIADGVANIVETLDAVVTTNKDRESAIRTVSS